MRMRVAARLLVVVACTSACRRTQQPDAPATAKGARLAECDRLSGPGPGGVDACYAREAPKLGDAAYCESIAGPGPKNNCFAGVASEILDASLCARIDESGQRAQCQESVAVATRSNAVCASIAGDRAKATCAQRVAREARDVAACFKLPDDLVSDCVVEVADDIDTCKRLTGDSRDACLRQLVRDLPYLGDEACPSVTSSRMADECWEAAARLRVRACERISTKERQETCVRGSATSRDEDACRTLTTHAQACTERVAIVARSVKPCLAIANDAGKDACIMTLAANTRSPAFCESASPAKRPDCQKKAKS